MHSTRCWKIALWARKRWFGCERWWLLDRLYRVVSGIRRQADSAHNGSQKNRDLFAAHSAVLSSWADTDRHSQTDSLLSQPFSRLCLVSHFPSFHNPHSYADNLCSGWPKLINWLTLEAYSKQLIYCRPVLTFSDWRQRRLSCSRYKQALLHSRSSVICNEEIAESHWAKLVFEDFGGLWTTVF